jgi:hypothetical protein
MKNSFVKSILKSKAFWVLSIFLLLNLYPVVQTTYGQEPKVTSINGIESQVKTSATSLIQMAKYIIGAVLFIALIGVIYMVASNHPKSKEGIIGWIVALVVYCIAVAVM